MDETPLPASLRTLLIVVAAVLALVGVGGIATGAADDDADDLQATSGGTTTTFGVTDTTLGVGTDGTTATTGGGTGTTIKGSTATTLRPGGSTGTTVAPKPSDACSAPDGAGAAPNSVAPAIGIYDYANCAEGSPGTETKVEAGSGADGKLRRRVTTSVGGNSVTFVRSYVNGAVILEALEIASPFGAIKCDVEPDVVETPAGLAKGKQWSGSGSCDQPPPVGKITFKGTGKVTGSKTVTIGGTAVQAWVIESQITVTAAGQTQNTTGVSYYDPVRGIDLFQRAEVNGEVVELRLASLTPRPI